jgi:hypothetical protein
MTRNTSSFKTQKKKKLDQLNMYIYWKLLDRRLSFFLSLVFFFISEEMIEVVAIHHLDQLIQSNDLLYKTTYY